MKSIKITLEAFRELRKAGKMAAPADLTIFKYGPGLKYKMNQTLTDPNDDILEVQGVGLLKRKAITVATVTGKRYACAL